MSLDVFNSNLGYFGKLPSYGDFVSRRMPASVQDHFDQWLQRGILRGKHELGKHWLPIWLNSPLWRFVVGPGICNDHAWAGVMMPSQDRVGRCFPLILVAQMKLVPTLNNCFGTFDLWFTHLEELALSSLETDFSLEQLEQALSYSICPKVNPVSSPAWDAVKHVADHQNAVPISTISDASRKSVWWTTGSKCISPCVAICNELPRADLFVSFLDGNWEKRGWEEIS